MVQNINQFNQTPDVGDPDLQPGFVLSCVVDPSEVVALTPGQAVKLSNTGNANFNGAPFVTATLADTDEVFGFVVRNLKNSTYNAGARVEIALLGAVQWQTAGGAITRGSQLEYDVATKKVIKSEGINPQIGIALDKATADGQLVRVLILTPRTSTPGVVQSATVTATLAEINAGKVLIPGTAGKSIKVTNFIEKVSGNFSTLTSLDLQDETTGTKVAVVTQAGLTNGAIIIPSESHVTLGAGFGVGLTAGEGLKVVKVGSAATGGTSVTFTVTYVLV